MPVIAQFISGIDNTILIIIIALMIIIAAALLFKRARKRRAVDNKNAWMQHIGNLPSVKPVHAATPVPVSRAVQKQPVLPVTDADITENCQNLQQSLQVLVGKYSLDSFTIATSDGLVFASSGAETAQADAAHYCRYNAGKDPAGMTLFGLHHNGSELTGIIRSSDGISPEILKRIENDTKDILNWWI